MLHAHHDHTTVNHNIYYHDNFIDQCMFLTMSGFLIKLSQIKDQAKMEGLTDSGGSPA